jgi:hypothetical protein
MVAPRPGCVLLVVLFVALPQRPSMAIPLSS